MSREVMHGYSNEYEKGIYNFGFADGRVAEFERIEKIIERAMNFDKEKVEMFMDFIREDIPDKEL